MGFAASLELREGYAEGHGRRDRASKPRGSTAAGLVVMAG
jgi:hypothetical protein